MIELEKKTITIAGTKFVVREMKGTERFKVADIEEKEGATGVAGFILKRCIVSPKDLAWDDLPARICDRLVNEVVRLSSMGAEAVEDAEKKSEETTN